MTFDYDLSPDSVCTQPMSADKLSYFATLKKPHLDMTGSYTYQGSKQTCKDKQCLMMMDNGRTHNPYGVAYYWVLFMTRLPDGRLFTMNFGYGMTTKYDGLDQSSEDFVAIDG